GTSCAGAAFGGVTGRCASRDARPARARASAGQSEADAAAAMGRALGLLLTRPRTRRGSRAGIRTGPATFALPRTEVAGTPWHTRQGAVLQALAGPGTDNRSAAMLVMAEIMRTAPRSAGRNTRNRPATHAVKRVMVVPMAGAHAVDLALRPALSGGAVTDRV